MEERRFKEQIYELVARIAKAADSPRRLEILEVLAQGPRTVESLAKETALSVAKPLVICRSCGRPVSSRAASRACSSSTGWRRRRCSSCCVFCE